ncbi:proline-rich protein 4-like [Orussus abietinus]|uniref:proline-rich protein 4-like n=1 Tax=Orussus abietinus TaxID=222816 RepID=UPI000C716123|nr:proline-rich protein 4-like [Orussus abietinus]
MRTFVLVLCLVGHCYASFWSFDGHGGGLTLGEISLDHHHDLPAISLGEHGHELTPLESVDHGWHGWQGGWDEQISIGHAGHGIKVIPVVKHIGIPVVKEVEIKIPHPVVQTVPQPYPVAVPVPQPVPYEVIKPVFTKVEKKVPTPVEKIIPVKVEKPVPFKVYKHIPVPVEKPVPIKIPVYKTVYHKSGWH